MTKLKGNKARLILASCALLPLLHPILVEAFNHNLIVFLQNHRVFVDACLVGKGNRIILIDGHIVLLHNNFISQLLDGNVHIGQYMRRRKVDAVTIFIHSNFDRIQ